jgi:molybdenum cofactor cytidylyltransferase
MGRNKMLLALDGETLVRRAASAALAAGLAPVVVVVGFEEERVRRELEGLDCQASTNPNYTGPTSGSLHVGLRAITPDAEAAAVILADMVHVSVDMLRDLVAATKVSTAPLFVSRYRDVTAPPLLFRRALFPELLDWHGEGCGKAVVRAHAHEAVYLDWPPGALEDVDTPEDFVRAGGRSPRNESDESLA